MTLPTTGNEGLLRGVHELAFEAEPGGQGRRILVTVLGLSVGSFVNVLIWRLPHNESIIRPNHWNSSTRDSRDRFSGVRITDLPPPRSNPAKEAL